MRLNESATPGWLWRAVGCGGCAVAVLYLLGLMLAVWIRPLRGMAQTVACRSNVRRVVIGMRMYADDYDDRLPPSSFWMDRVEFYLDDRRRLHCPTAAPQAATQRYGYAIDSRRSGQVRGRIEQPDSVPLVFDSANLVRSAADPLASLPRPGRHQARDDRNGAYRRGNVIGYVDGHAQVRFTSGGEKGQRP